jgi:ketosteroid isomerase-like protein
MKRFLFLQMFAGVWFGIVGVRLAHAELTVAQADAFARDFYSVYNAAGAPKLADFYAAEATLTDPTFGLDLHGREQIGNLLTKALAKYESLEHEVLYRTVAGDDLVVEGLMIGKLSGKPLRVRFVSVFHFKDGKILQQRDMFDLLHFFEQLGVVPMQFRPKTDAPAKSQGS